MNLFFKSPLVLTLVCLAAGACLPTATASSSLTLKRISSYAWGRVGGGETTTGHQQESLPPSQIVPIKSVDNDKAAATAKDYERALHELWFGGRFLGAGVSMSLSYPDDAATLPPLPAAPDFSFPMSFSMDYGAFSMDYSFSFPPDAVVTTSFTSGQDPVTGRRRKVPPPTASPSTATSTTNTQQSATVGESNENNNSDNDDDDGGMSGEAKAAVSVLMVAGAMAMVGLLVNLGQKRRYNVLNHVNANDSMSLDESFATTTVGDQHLSDTV